MKLKVEVFSSPGCSKCKEARRTLERLVQEEGEGRIEWREVNILEELDYAVELGVLSAPAIAINGRLEFTGLPRQGRLLSRIRERLTQKPRQGGGK